jgi:hypothetical protein
MPAFLERLFRTRALRIDVDPDRNPEVKLADFLRSYLQTINPASGT